MTPGDVDPTANNTDSQLSVVANPKAVAAAASEAAQRAKALHDAAVAEAEEADKAAAAAVDERDAAVARARDALARQDRHGHVDARMPERATGTRRLDDLRHPRTPSLAQRFTTAP